eukprot:TRINITY_DN70989_c0_g1_i1.p1 TRINITY_DN70989_c0_g1~~TRINITY_DN70989_c0_g1_i1.p1  ORF type:complete len:233 (+),score=25.96 TRINITY_DN70989_c0_g1_i1:75-701(+)
MALWRAAPRTVAPTTFSLLGGYRTSSATAVATTATAEAARRRAVLFAHSNVPTSATHCTFAERLRLPVLTLPTEKASEAASVSRFHPLLASPCSSREVAAKEVVPCASLLGVAAVEKAVVHQPTSRDNLIIVAASAACSWPQPILAVSAATPPTDVIVPLPSATFPGDVGSSKPTPMLAINNRKELRKWKQRRKRNGGKDRGFRIKYG